MANGGEWMLKREMERKGERGVGYVCRELEGCWKKIRSHSLRTSKHQDPHTVRKEQIQASLI